MKCRNFPDHGRLQCVAIMIGSLLFISNASASPSPISGGFIDAWSYFAAQEPAKQEEVITGPKVDAALDAQFKRLCDDSFCGREYANLTSMGLYCTVSTISHQVGQCAWVFSGTKAQLNSRSGAQTIQSHTFICDLGVQGTASELAAFLSQLVSLGSVGIDGIFKVKVPGTARTLYDNLNACL